MKPLITVDAMGDPRAPKHIQTWASQVGKKLARNNRHAPRVWPYRHAGFEQLSCDYENFSITFMVTGGETKPFDPEDVLTGNCTDMEVHDMTEALMLVSRLELARGGDSVVRLG
jgi:hypothetical protein